MLPCGLDSVTVAPGSTAPDESVTVPPIAPTPCANTGGVAHAHNANAMTILTKRFAVIVIPSCQRGFVGTVGFARDHTPRLLISLQSFAPPACMLTPFRVPANDEPRRDAMARSTVRVRLSFVALTLLLPVEAQGQLASGSIIGTVRDSTGAVMQAVSVSARSRDTGAVRTATTDAAGTYQIPSVPAGDYDVQATAAGFQTAIRSRIAVTVGAAVSVNFALELGTIEQDVSVTAEA